MMAYTPELSLKYSGMLRRVAWAANVPMTKALEDLVRLLPVVFNAGKVCAACKDVTFCQSCGFAHKNKGGDDEVYSSKAPVSRQEMPTGGGHPTGAGNQCITKKRQKEKKCYENSIED